MNLEVKKDDTAHTFSFPNDVFGNDRRLKNSKVAITTAKIKITKSGGTSVLTETNMTIAVDTFSASYSWDATGQDVEENYILTFTINGAIYNRFIDIYYYPFLNTVCDNDLFAIDKSVKEKSWRVAGSATGGTLTTLVDTNRIEDDDKFNGGLIELYYDSKIETREITDFVKTTNTFTFTPAVSVAVSDGLGYAARESYQEDIDYAADEVRERFTQIEKRAYLLLDHSQARRAIINKTLANYWRQKVKAEDDEYDIKYKFYLSEFESYFANTKWKYDADADAELDDDEFILNTRPRWER
jgi:hypothetical protein